jgi:hypothetical protein
MAPATDGINGRRDSLKKPSPEGLKPAFILGFFGTTEVVPFHGGFKLTHYRNP